MELCSLVPINRAPARGPQPRQKNPVTGEKNWVSLNVSLLDVLALGNFAGDYSNVYNDVSTEYWPPIEAK